MRESKFGGMPTNIEDSTELTTLYFFEYYLSYSRDVAVAKFAKVVDMLIKDIRELYDWMDSERHNKGLRPLMEELLVDIYGTSTPLRDLSSIGLYVYIPSEKQFKRISLDLDMVRKYCGKDYIPGIGFYRIVEVSDEVLYECENIDEYHYIVRKSKDFLLTKQIRQDRVYKIEEKLSRLNPDEVSIEYVEARLQLLLETVDHPSMQLKVLKEMVNLLKVKRNTPSETQSLSIDFDRFLPEE